MGRKDRPWNRETALEAAIEWLRWADKPDTMEYLKASPMRRPSGPVLARLLGGTLHEALTEAIRIRNERERELRASLGEEVAA